MTFEHGDLAVLNENSDIGIPKHIGDLVQITNTEGSPMYDYKARLLCNGRIISVKDIELSHIDKNNPLLMFNIGNKLLYKPTDEECEIVKIDYLYNQIEVKFKDGSCRVERPESLQLNENDIERKSETKSNEQNLVKLFLSPYKKENTYHIPENLMDEIITELQQRW
ncbi:hypothetical protein [Siminovitchia fordii]|uniref:Uncharacterized protein n=1 Tax=Siminovitchia fordii TaxID=254759 RepID=A0ABQ4K9X5_9BACI|nr:hypothetical protein [Siminovitchia fordii]GIN22522.1 hypothetical protein J1TS3_36560 [Siminovitchia fordii]